MGKQLQPLCSSTHLTFIPGPTLARLNLIHISCHHTQVRLFRPKREAPVAMGASFAARIRPSNNINVSDSSIVYTRRASPFDIPLPISIIQQYIDSPPLPYRSGAGIFRASCSYGPGYSCLWAGEVVPVGWAGIGILKAISPENWVEHGRGRRINRLE
jgi:hypothetical protein